MSGALLFTAAGYPDVCGAITISIVRRAGRMYTCIQLQYPVVFGVQKNLGQYERDLVVVTHSYRLCPGEKVKSSIKTVDRKAYRQLQIALLPNSQS